MKKYLKTITLAILAVCVAVCATLLCACNNSSDDKGKFTVTVLLEDNTPAVGVKVGLCVDDSCQIPAPVDENGKIVIDYVKEFGSDAKTAHIRISKTTIPEGYIYADENGDEYPSDGGVEVVFAETSSCTIILKKI